MKWNQFFADICNGSSVIDIGFPCYIRHLNFVEQTEISVLVDNEIKRGQSLGLLKEKEIIKNLIRDQKWSGLKEKSIESCEKDIYTLSLSKRNVKDRFEIDGLYNSIQELREKHFGLIKERYPLIGETAESFADNVVKPYQLSISLYKDKEFTKPAFSLEDLEYMDTERYLSILGKYLDSSHDFNDENIKRLCIEPFFYGWFSMSEESFNFFGKPLIKLTLYQTRLIMLAKTFSKVAYECPDLPDEYAEIPDKVYMWYYLKQNDGVVTKEEAKEEENKIRSLFKQ